MDTARLCLRGQRYKSVSKSQPELKKEVLTSVVSTWSKIQKRKQITTLVGILNSLDALCLRGQRYKSVSKSQPIKQIRVSGGVVSAWSKIQKRKQITTVRKHRRMSTRLCLRGQRYKSVSKSQHSGDGFLAYGVVSAWSKIQKRKQITTQAEFTHVEHKLCLRGQRYKSVSKSQQFFEKYGKEKVVSAWSKIQKRKQITTDA